MPVEYFLRYNGQCYDVGTRLKLNFYGTIRDGTIEWISHNHVYIRFTDGTGHMFSKVWSLDKTIVQIIEPVYYIESPKQQIRGGSTPSINDIFVGWAWYIVIMFVGVIFEDRWLIWLFATIIFFTWKNGGMKK